MPDPGALPTGQAPAPLTGRGATRRPRGRLREWSIPMRKVLLALAAAVIALSAAPAAAAFAASSPVLTCNIQPNSNDVFHATSCGTTKVASSYSDFCILQGVRAFGDLSLVATVVIKQGSSSTTQSVTARLNAVCGNMLC